MKVDRLSGLPGCGWCGRNPTQPTFGVCYVCSRLAIHLTEKTRENGGVIAVLLMITLTDSPIGCSLVVWLTVEVVVKNCSLFGQFTVSKTSGVEEMDNRF